MNATVIIAAVTLIVACVIALAAALLLAVGAAVVGACAWVWVTVAADRYEKVLAARDAAAPLPPSVTYAVRTWRLGRDAGDANGLYDSAQWDAEAAALPPAVLPRHAVLDDTLVMAAVGGGT